MVVTEKKKQHLRELLEYDQEPFHLNHYISDLRSQMSYSHLHVKKRNPQHSAIHIPARTAAILLEAAARIHKQQSEKPSNRGSGFRSVLRRLINRKAKPCLVLSEPARSSRRECLLEIGDKCFCESTFHLVPHATPSSSGHRTSHFTSTATSPVRRSSEDEDSDETESLEKVRGQEEEDKKEEDKEQCSPVSVLDPLEEEDHHHHQEEPDHHNLLSCSFEVVQRAKRRLLKKLCRFEKLVRMEPIDLEEEEYEDDNMRVYNLAEEYEDADEAMARERGWEEEERRKKNDGRHKKWRMMNAWSVGMGAEEVAEAVLQKDIRGEAGEWTRHGEEIDEVVSDIELSIFFFLIDELSHELVSSSMDK